MTRTPFLAANFKMFKTVHEAVAYAKEFRALVKNLDDVEIVVAPPFTALHAVAEASRNSIVCVAGQDVYWEKEGAFTGEVSAAMLKEAGRRVRDHRPLGAPPDVRRHRRGRQPQDAGGHPGRAVPDRLRRRDARGARSQPHPRGARSPGEGRPRRPLGRAGGRPGAGLRAGLGHRHRPQRHARAGRRGARPHPRAAASSGSGRTRPRSATSSTAAASSRTTWRPWPRCATSTARWSAAPAWIRTVSPRSSPTSRPPGADAARA